MKLIFSKHFIVHEMYVSCMAYGVVNIKRWSH